MVLIIALIIHNFMLRLNDLKILKNIVSIKLILLKFCFK